jgi:hypothetical protein
MLVYIPKETKTTPKTLPPEYQLKETLFLVNWKSFIKFGRYELTVFLLIILFTILISLFFIHDLFGYAAVLLNPLSIYAFARFPLLIVYYLNDRHNEFEVDYDEQKMYFKSGREIHFSEIEEIELHKGGLFPDALPTFYQPFGRYQYIGVILKTGEKFILTRLLMKKFINFPILEFKFFRDPYPFIHPTKI